VLVSNVGHGDRKNRGGQPLCGQDKTIARILVVRVVWKNSEAAAGFDHNWKVTDVRSNDGGTVSGGS
jgi:hypothetical protein